MSLHYHTREKADLKHRDYGFILAGFILALVCLALGLVVASSISTPEAVVAGINSESLFVGP
jgi:hypothetical protein